MNEMQQMKLDDVKPINGYVKLTVEGETAETYIGVGEWPDASRIRIAVVKLEVNGIPAEGETRLVKQQAICGVLGEPIRDQDSRIILPDSAKVGALTLLK